ncbi:hypothetical protein ACFLXA_00180 [Chloroflexota bacterium]
MQGQKFGIYLNTKELKVLRINSPYWIPSGEEWTFVTPEVNATLLSIRRMVQQRGLIAEHDKIVWGSITEFKE